MSCSTFTMENSDGWGVFPEMPLTIAFDDTRELKLFDLWSGGRLVYDIAKDSETLSMGGIQSVSAVSTAVSIASFVDDGAKVSISGFNNPEIDADYYIENFTYSVSQPNSIEWSLTLIKS